MNVRAAAAQAVHAVVDRGRSLDTALERRREAVRPADRALLQELAYGVVRWYPRLDALARALLRKPLKDSARDVHALVLVGLYQLIYARVPAHAAVGETVQAVRALNQPWAAGLINGVLRSFQRRAHMLLAQVDRDPVNALAHPGWLLEVLQRDWPGDWQGIVAANNARAPMTLRINARRVTCADYAARLQADGLDCAPDPMVEGALRLREPVAVERLPGFAEGEVSVQDAAAQLAAPLLEAAPGMRVLDACAAPGGKSAHILESCPELAELVALDVDEQRLQRVRETLQRLGLQAQVQRGDAADPGSWWDGRPFDRVLIDAPCSGTGVIRRHPDIKLLRRAADVDALARRQCAILEALWSLLAPGGMLVYATCSTLDRENVQQMVRFLGEHPDAREREIQADWGRSRHPGRQILPGEGDMDGFYYARLQKQP